MKVKTCSTIKYFDFFFQITKIFHVNTQITKVLHYSQKYICFKQTKKSYQRGCVDTTDTYTQIGGLRGASTPYAIVH